MENQALITFVDLRGKKKGLALCIYKDHALQFSGTPVYVSAKAATQIGLSEKGKSVNIPRMEVIPAKDENGDDLVLESKKNPGTMIHIMTLGKTLQ